MRASRIFPMSGDGDIVQHISPNDKPGFKYSKEVIFFVFVIMVWVQIRTQEIQRIKYRMTIFLPEPN